MDTFVSVDTETRRQVVEKVAQTLCDLYVFPELAQKMSDALLASLVANEYDDLVTADELCERLTAELQEISRDKHVRVRYNEEARPLSGAEDFSAEEIAAWIDQARRANFGFYKIERLAGNIGYLDLRNFWDAGWEGAGEAAAGAMSVLLHTDALIFDLRQNGGGSPSMVALLISYLVGPEPVHLNSFYDRGDNKTIQSWTLPYVPGRRTPDKLVYVLTSKRTFSGAEEFAYNLKNLKRATIVGEATGGGAHPGRDISVTPHFRVFVPQGRPINPISGTNWEGSGVAPDVAVPQEEALRQAHQLALRELLAKLEGDPSVAAQAQANEAREALAVFEASTD